LEGLKLLQGDEKDVEDKFLADCRLLTAETPSGDISFLDGRQLTALRAVVNPLLNLLNRRQTI
jgi:hypothetical protein